MRVDWGSCLINDTLTISCLPILFHAVIFWLLSFAGTAALFLIIFSGIKFINSGGNPKTVEDARKTATYAIIGLIIIACSFLIVETIANVMGVSCIKDLSFTSC